MRTKVVHCKLEPFDIYIGRTNKRKFHFGNTYVIGPDGNREEVCDKFDLWLDGKIDIDREPERRVWILENMHTLNGRRMGCFCKYKPWIRCHGDSYVKRLEEESAIH